MCQKHPQNGAIFLVCLNILQNMLTSFLEAEKAEILHKVVRLTCVAHCKEIANVAGALSVYDSHRLRAQSLLQQVRRAHSPH